MKEYNKIVGDMIKRATGISTAGTTVMEVADRVGMNRVNLSNVLNGHAEVSVRLAVALEIQYGMKAYDILTYLLISKMSDERLRQNAALAKQQQLIQ